MSYHHFGDSLSFSINALPLDWRAPWTSAIARQTAAWTYILARALGTPRRLPQGSGYWARECGLSRGSEMLQKGLNAPFDKPVAASHRHSLTRTERELPDGAGLQKHRKAWLSTATGSVFGGCGQTRQPCAAHRQTAQAQLGGQPRGLRSQGPTLIAPASTEQGEEALRSRLRAPLPSVASAAATGPGGGGRARGEGCPGPCSRSCRPAVWRFELRSRTGGPLYCSHGPGFQLQTASQPPGPTGASRLARAPACAASQVGLLGQTIPGPPPGYHGAPRSDLGLRFAHPIVVWHNSWTVVRALP